MNYFKILIISLIITILGLFVFYQYIPLQPVNFLNKQTELLGSTITTMNGSDTLKDSRSVINTNFTNLNNGKLETSSFYSTTTHANIATLPALTTAGSLSITRSQVSDFGSWDVSGQASSTASALYFYPAFTYSTSTAWTGTTTQPIGTAYVVETWSGVQCFTDTGTVTLRFADATSTANSMNYVIASTTVNTNALTTNNTYTAKEKRYVEMGSPSGSPTKISCTVRKLLNPLQ